MPRSIDIHLSQPGTRYLGDKGERLWFLGTLATIMPFWIRRVPGVFCSLHLLRRGLACKRGSGGLVSVITTLSSLLSLCRRAVGRRHPRLQRRPPTVDDEPVARHRARLVGGEEERGIRDILRIGHELITRHA